MTRRLVVIGNGMAATRLVQRLVERDPARFAITVVGDEPHPAYNRIQLSPLLAGEKRRRRSRCCRRSGIPGTGCACGLARRSMKSIFSNGGCASRKPGCRGMNWCSPPVRGPLSRRCRALIVRRLCPSAPPADVERILAIPGPAVVIGGGVLGWKRRRRCVVTAERSLFCIAAAD